MRILVTGGCGFVGSTLAIEVKRKYPDYEIVALDNLIRRGSELNVQRLAKNNIAFVHGDIRSQSDLDNIGKVDLIIEAAAEPSVQSGVSSSPDYVIETNLVGTLNCMRLAHKHAAKVIFLSTSRVYSIPALEETSYEEHDTRFVLSKSQGQVGISEQGISEEFSTAGPKSFYGATKFASEVILNEYHSFQNLSIVINRCGVLTGPWQFGKVDQGIFVLWLASHYWKRPLSYIGYGGQGKQVRDVLHISDLFNLIDYQIHNFEAVNGKTFNVGGGMENSVSLLELTAICEEVTGNSISISAQPENRAADVRIYATNNQLVSETTGWQPTLTISDIAEDIHNWISENESILNKIFNK